MKWAEHFHEVDRSVYLFGRAISDLLLCVEVEHQVSDLVLKVTNLLYADNTIH